MILIDPVSAYWGDKDTHRDAEVRGVLAPLQILAGETGVAVICVAHFNKDDRKQAMSRISGSLAFVAAWRAAYIMARDPENSRRRLFIPLKNNIAPPDVGGLACELQTVTLPSGIETVRLLWEQGKVMTTADQVLSSKHEDERHTAKDDAKEFLLDYLSGGEKPVLEVLAEARTAGISKHTLERAKQELKIRSVKISGDGKAKWAWELRAKDMPQDDDI